MKKILRIILPLFLLFLSTTKLFALAQYFYWVNPQTALRMRINADTYQIISETRPGKWQIVGKIKTDPNLFDDFPPSWASNYFYFQGGKKIRFTVEGTGWLFEYDTLSHQFRKLDNTYYRGFNFKAIQFKRKNIIYSFGGLGFWQSHNIQTYYDEQRAEWEAIRPLNQGPETINNYGFNGYSAKNDLFYSGGGESNISPGPDSKGYSNKFYQYDFKNSKWTLLGTLTKELPHVATNEAFWNGSYFFLWEGNQLCIIDPAENKIFAYKDPNKIFTTSNNAFAKGDTVYNYWDDKGNIEKFSVTEVLSKSEYIGPFYKQDYTPFYYLGALGFLVFGTVGLWYKRKIQTSSIPDFETAEKKLLKALLALGPNQSLFTHDINDILNINVKSQDNQRRIRVNIINQINEKIYKYLRVKEAVQRKVSEEDKRLSLYHLKPEVTQRLREIINLD